MMATLVHMLFSEKKIIPHLLHCSPYSIPITPCRKVTHLCQGTESAETETNLGSIKNVNLQLSRICKMEGKLDHILFLQSLVHIKFIQISSKIKSNLAN